MTLNDCFELGWVTKPRSFKGEVVVHLDTDYPEQFLEMESVFVLVDGNLIPFFIETLNLQKGKSVRIKFEGIDTEERAKALKGSKLFLPLDQQPELDEYDQFIEDIIGFTVIDEEKGELGILKDVIKSDHNPLFEIEHPSGTEILMPMQDEYVGEVDRENKIVNVKCPEGLVDLYIEL